MGNYNPNNKRTKKYMTEEQWNEEVKKVRVLNKYQLEVVTEYQNHIRRTGGQIEKKRKDGSLYTQERTIEHKESQDLEYLVMLVSKMIELAKRRKTVWELSWIISENYKPLLRGEYVRKGYIPR